MIPASRDPGAPGIPPAQIPQVTLWGELRENDLRIEKTRAEAEERRQERRHLVRNVMLFLIGTAIGALVGILI